MGCENQPIQVIVHCGADGEQHPLRFQYQDRQRQIHTVQISQVIDSRLAGEGESRAFLYLCKASSGGRECLYELRYGVESLRWSLFRQIY